MFPGCTHGVCFTHCYRVFGMNMAETAAQSSADTTSTICPVCALECTCSSCSKRMNKYGHNLQVLMKLHKKIDVADAEFSWTMGDITVYSQGGSVNAVQCEFARAPSISALA